MTQLDTSQLTNRVPVYSYPYHMTQLDTSQLTNRVPVYSYPYHNDRRKYYDVTAPDTSQLTDRVPVYSYPYHMTQLDTSQLTNRVPVYSYPYHNDRRKYYDVTAPDIWGWYQECYYGLRPGDCYYIVVVPADKEYSLCMHIPRNLYIQEYRCDTYSASDVCLYTQPSTNRLLHQTVPPTVYITGLIFNILIILVLCFKEDKSVLNVLLLMLSVWDLLYLGCLVSESVIGHYGNQPQIQISDISYAWLHVRCKMGDYTCGVRNQWRNADINIKITSQHYPLMYWLHVSALVFQIASVYQTIVIATFRCIAIRRPFQAPQLLTSTTAAVATGCCLLLGVAVHVPAFLAGQAVTDFLNCKVKECASNITAPIPLYTASTTTFTDIHQYYHVITYSIILFMALPFTLLLILNILMLLELHQGTGPSHDDENKAVTKVVVAIVMVFLFTYIVKPLYIVDIYYFQGYVMDSIAWQSCGGYFTMSILITVLPAINSVINFLLYVGLRQTFRDQFTSMFSCCKRDFNPQRPEAIPLQAIHR